MGSRFEFPTLPREKMLEVLRNTEISTAVEKDLSEPKPEFLYAVFARFLDFLGLLEEDQQHQYQIDFDVLEKLETDRHMDSIRFMVLYKRIDSLLVSLGCPLRFRMEDLIRPKADRTEFFLGAILNYCVHREAKLNSLKSVWDGLSSVDDQRAELADKKTQLNSEMAFYIEERERELPLIQEAEAKGNALKEEIHSLNTQQMSLRATYRTLKEQVHDMEEKINNAEFAVVRSAQENAELHSKIVQSPDKLQRTVEEKKSTLEEAKISEGLAHQSFRDKTAKLELCSAVMKKISKLYVQLEAIQKQVNDFKDVEKELKAGKIKLSNDELMDMSLEAKRIERQGIAQKLDEVKKQLENERNMKWEEAHRELQNMRILVESRRHDLEARQRNVEAMVAEVDALTTETNLVKVSGAAQVQQLIKKREELTTELRQYMQDIDSSVQTLMNKDI